MILLFSADQERNALKHCELSGTVHKPMSAKKKLEKIAA